MKILFICRGNVGRSQMAEVLFNKLANGEHSCFSAGTRVLDKQGKSVDGQKIKDLPAANEVIEVLKEIGVDASENARTQLTPEILEEADRAIVMAEEYSIPDYLAASNKVTYWNVEDPKGKSLEFTRGTRDQIRGLVEGLVQQLNMEQKEI